MSRNWKEEFNITRRNALNIVRTADDPKLHTLYLSFTTYGKRKYEQMNFELLDNAKLDLQLGVITQAEYKEIEASHDIIERSIALGTVY